MNWLKKLFSKTREEKSRDIVDSINSKMFEIRQAGSIGRDHYTSSIEKIKQLKLEGKQQEVLGILIEAVEATEAESKFAGGDWGVAPWYYEQLTIIYRKEKQNQQEIEILERYAAQPKDPGAKPEKLAQRLVKAKELLAKSKV